MQPQLKQQKAIRSAEKLDTINWLEKTNALLIYVKATLRTIHNIDEEIKESATLPSLPPVATITTAYLTIISPRCPLPLLYL